MDRSQKFENIFIWLKAVYHFHIFHYRMPETVAISAVTPFVPSPLTIKMALVASLLQVGDVDGAENIAKHIHEIEVEIIPPKAGISFKAFLRYISPPAVDSEKGLEETGSYYHSRPHMREYAILQGNLTIYVKAPKNIENHVEKALRNIRYLGCKDSIVTNLEISRVATGPSEDMCVNKLNQKQQGVVVLLADFKSNAYIGDIRELLPGVRRQDQYEISSFILPGYIKTKGRSKLFKAFFE